MRYFDHDTTAASDSLITYLRLECGGAAVDAYYTFLEEIYATEDAVIIEEAHPQFLAISHRLATDKQTLNGWLEAMEKVGLLIISTHAETGEKIAYSERAMLNIEAYQEKREKARLAGQKGGSKSKRKATAKQTLSDRKADAKLRKEKKGDITSSVISPTSDGAVAVKTAPPAVDETTQIFLEVDEQFPSPQGYEPKDMSAYLEEFNAEQSAKTESIPCPENLNPFKESA